MPRSNPPAIRRDLVRQRSDVSHRRAVRGGTDVTPCCVHDNRITLAPPFAYNTCVDRDGDGRITTSAGLVPLDWPNTGGVDDDGGVDTAVDECIVAYIRTNASRVHHVSVDKDNNVWVGGHASDNTFELLAGDRHVNPLSGAVVEVGDSLRSFDVGCGGLHGLIDGNDVLWSASNGPHSRRVFRYDTTAQLTQCCPDILADSNNDLIINNDDEATEDQPPGVAIYINSDDDNLNGVPDMDDLGPVDRENDLAELQLYAGCSPSDPAQAHWSLSRQDPGQPGTPAIKVWMHSNKSVDGVSGAGAPLINGYQYGWPPPTSVWMETLDLYDGVLLEFAVLPAPGAFMASDTVRTDADPRIEISLRVVMFVEAGRNVDEIPFESGGCKLTRSQIRQIIRDLIAYGDRAARGLRYVWAPTEPITILQSPCMQLMPPPWAPDISACYDTVNFPGGNPRRMLWEWFVKEAVAQGGDTQAGLVCTPYPIPQGSGLSCHDIDVPGCPNDPFLFCDGYDPDPCTVNIYFIGGSSNLSGGGTLVSNVREYPDAQNGVVMIPDSAGSSGSGPVTNAADFLIHFHVLPHEVGCHWLTNLPGHVPPEGVPGGPYPIPPVAQCPNCLCFESPDYVGCMIADPPKPMDTVPTLWRLNTEALRKNCNHEP